MDNTIINSKSLTKKQRDVLNILYLQAKLDCEIEDVDSHSDRLSIIGYARKTLLEEIFGKELFKQDIF